MNASPPTPEKTPANGPQAHVLLVDDRRANLVALEAILHDLGLNLVTAQSGEEALRRLEEEDFAVVLLDVQMHGLDGFETAKVIRSRERSRHTPVIFLTAHDVDRPLVEQAYALGAVDLLVKPLVPVILRAKVAGFVDLYLKTEQVKRQAEQLRRVERKEFDQAVRESEARKSAILETALDCIITIDHEDRIIEFNPAAERTFGYSRADVLGRPMAELIVPPSLREQHYRGMKHFLATGEGPVLNKRIEVRAMRADGTEFPVELAITPTMLDGSPIFTAYLRDISEREDRERRRNARLAVTQALAQAGSLDAAATGILRAVCEGLGWDVGGLWGVDRDGGVIRCVEVCVTAPVRAERFEAATRRAAFRRGEGLPGRVWEGGTPEWIPDVVRDARFPRALLAAEDGLHGAFAFPISLHAEVVGVMEFFSREVREPDPDLLEMLTSIGGRSASSWSGGGRKRRCGRARSGSGPPSIRRRSGWHSSGWTTGPCGPIPACVRCSATPSPRCGSGPSPT